ncbi:hypothetical protein, partial [Marinovum sp. 1_MG-2023]|uniref:hypothetical protein n=1 Tax=Marinovum sp. 1_MG-2023 TaxID=3062633 RepID=UPI0026E3B0C3
ELDDYEGKTKNIEILVVAMLSSVLVMMALVVSGVINSLLSYEFIHKQIKLYRGISSFTIFYLCLLQLMAVLPVAGLSLNLAIRLHH